MNAHKLRPKHTTACLIVTFVIAVALFAPGPAHAKSNDADEFFCQLVADAAQVAANARDQGLLLGQYKSMIAQRATPDTVGMTAILNKVGAVVYTSEDFAAMTPEQASRYAYRSCLSGQAK